MKFRNKGHYPPLNPLVFWTLRNFVKPRLTDCIENELKKKSVFVDVGANIGFYSILASKKVGKNGKVFSFEPEHKNHRLLRKNIRRNHRKNIVPLKKVVGEKDGKISFYINKDNPSDHRAYNNNENWKHIELDSVNLDNFFKESNHKVDFVKIDVQGFEESVLNGMKQIIHKNKQIKIIMEFWPVALESAGTKPEKIISYLDKEGFKFYPIRENGKYSRVLSATEVLNKLPKNKDVDLLCKR